MQESTTEGIAIKVKKCLKVKRKLTDGGGVDGCFHCTPTHWIWKPAGDQQTWHSALGGGVVSLSVQQQASRIT